MIKKTKSFGPRLLKIAVSLLIFTILFFFVGIGVKTFNRSKAKIAGISTSDANNITTSWNSTGDQKILVLLYNFEDGPNNKPFTKQEVESTIFAENDSANSIINTFSFGKTSLSGAVVDWFTSPVTNTFNGQPACLAANGENYALENARNLGIDVDSYPRRIFIYPYVEICGPGASGSTGGNPSFIEINGSFDKSLIVHELIHNFGVGHSHFLNCTPYSIASYSQCTVSSYSDFFSIMGYAGSDKNLPVFQKNFLTWVPDNDIVEVNSSGEYDLHSQQNNSGIRSLKIRKQDTGEYYYLDYDRNHGTTIRVGYYLTNYIDGTVYPVPETKLINTSPLSNLGISDSILIDNKDFIDDTNGFKITQISSDQTHAVIRVLFTNLNPSPSPSPTLSIVGDINEDGVVNIVDIGIIIDNYGTTPPTNMSADLNHDGIVNIVDIGIVIDNYGV